MAYFNHAFNKTFVGTEGFVSGGQPTTALAKGEFSFYDPKTWNQVTDSSSCCPLVLVSGSIHEGKDKIGPYHGGYAESVKSKTINAKYVSSFYKVLPCAPQQAQVVVGATLNGDGGSCVKEFLCGETYNLRVDIKGSPVLRTLTRNTYYTATAYTGCCDADAIAPTPVNPLIVYVNWAYQLLNSPLINPFIQVQITYSTNGGGTWFELGDGSSSKTNLDLLLGYIQNPSTLPANATPADTLGGLIINGAYVDTRFGDCTFYPNDSIIAFLEPVRIYASEVDLNGDPCAFQGLCVNTTCDPIQIKGTGENVIRDLILTEGYMQQPFYTGTDLRIREITNGTDVYDAISRSSYYTRYYIQHNVPRFNNPSSTFDNDQYLLEIVGAPEMHTVMLGGGSYNAGTDTTTFTVADATGAYVGGQVDFDNGDDNGTITAISGNTIAVGGNYAGYSNVNIIFYDATLWNFEKFFQSWLQSCNSNCAELVTYTCPATCTRVEVTND